MSLGTERRWKDHSRHEAGHTDQTVDTSETDTDSPQPRCSDDPLAQSLVSRLETEDSTGSTRESVVDLLAGMVGESGVLDPESEGVKVLGDELRRSLLAVESQSERLNTTEEEERVEGGQCVSDGVDREGDSLRMMRE